MHEKKQKGDIGVTQVIARLTEFGWTIGVLISEHAKYDLFAEKDGVVHTVQVRHCSSNGERINIPLFNGWSDKNGCHKIKRKKGNYTLLAAYVPNHGIYFIKDKDIGDNTNGITLRIKESKNGQLKGCRLAKDFLTI